MTSIVRGSLKPDLEVTIADARGDANFSALDPDNVMVVVEQNGSLVVNAHPDSVVAAQDGKSAVVKRAWVDGETDAVGRMWVSVMVDWPNDKPQYFPADGPLRLDVGRAPGDA